MEDCDICEQENNMEGSFDERDQIDTRIKLMQFDALRKKAGEFIPEKKLKEAERQSKSLTISSSCVKLNEVSQLIHEVNKLGMNKRGELSK
jgi:hypothetical protein